MDTSKKHYETVMRDFRTYGRGRSLEQFCRDEAIDYKWIEKAKGLYGPAFNCRDYKKTQKLTIQCHTRPFLMATV